MIGACWKRDLTSQTFAGDSTPARVLPFGVLGASAVHSNCRVLEKHFMNWRESARTPQRTQCGLSVYWVPCHPRPTEENSIDTPALSDNVVSMKTITSRELSRKPSVISNIKPGEAVHVADRKGGLMMTRAKRIAVTPREMMAELGKLTAGCPPMDTQAFLEDGE